MEKIIIGTRGSILALAQAETVKDMLITKYDELRNKGLKIDGFENVEKLEVELKIIVTKGDKDFRDFKKIQGISQKDLFVKEIEKEMLDNTIDFAVHSLKDMPQITPEGLENVCFPLREDNRDVFVSKNGVLLKDLPLNSVIGTGSTRREAELLTIFENREDIKIKGIRGNIHTRLKKLEEEEYDGIILAAAGLKRVGLENRITEYMVEDEFMPAPGQGILCVQCRTDDTKIKKLLSIINDEEVKIMCEAEREFSRIFDGGCHTPIGCSSKIIGDEIVIKGMYNDKGKRIFKEIKGNKYDCMKLSKELAERIKGEINDEKR